MKGERQELKMIPPPQQHAQAETEVDLVRPPQRSACGHVKWNVKPGAFARMPGIISSYSTFELYLRRTNP